MRGQCMLGEGSLIDDFRVLAFLSSDMTDSKGKVLEEMMRAMSGTARALYLSREAVLSVLQEQDPELVKSVALIGENPLPPVLEISPDPEIMTRWQAWIDSVSKFPGVAEVLFNPVQLDAILRVQFYRRFLNLSLSLVAFLWCLGSAAKLWRTAAHKDSLRIFAGLEKIFAYSALGMMGGMGLIYLSAYPFKSGGEAWTWPSLWTQGLLFFTGVLGIGLIPQWGGPPDEHDDHRGRAQGTFLARLRALLPSKGRHKERPTQAEAPPSAQQDQSPVP